ncbi:MAG TPA: nascent polypeptide-associated complex protein [Nitrososphaerales archaeon]|nr:nascent polypeptide-associated complex protein [Nitrososphaerales archaeon]
MGMRVNDRNARRMMERMGINQKEIPNVEEVIIRTSTKDLVINGASVSEVNFQGNRVFQVAGEVEEVEREVRKFSDDDIILVQQQANVTREKAIAALEQSDGEVAKAIMMLTS